MTARVFDSRPCDLGEGPLWHPLRAQLFWFDILNRRLLSRLGEASMEWRFDEMVSAAGWVDEGTLLVASEARLFALDLAAGTSRTVAALDAGNAATRSNDGRADPQGGFWIGTMGKRAERGAGAIWRYHGGEVRRLFPAITIPNSIAFTPDGRTAQFADTAQSRVWRVALDADGWPAGQPETFLDLAAEGLSPDGAVFDATGRTWIAEWGAARVAAYAPDGIRVATVPVPAPHSSCPAFGGSTLYVTTALQDMPAAARAAQPLSGQTFAMSAVAPGLPEHRVTL